MIAETSSPAETRAPLSLRPAWWIVIAGLICSLSVNFVLPAFDHHAADYSPWHDHVVVGASTAAEREQALQAHTHGAGVPHSHGPTGAEHQAATVVAEAAGRAVIGTAALTDLLAVAASALVFVASADWPAPQPMAALWLALLPAALLLRPRTPLPPERPPRYA
jgi:hypothetical protein